MSFSLVIQVLVKRISKKKSKLIQKKKKKFKINQILKGKSTLLNGMIGEVKFKSGVSIGKGLTKTIQFVEHNGIMYGDTPGLSDVEYRKEAAQEITKALKQDGIYKLFFVACVEAGRVRPDDIITINLIMNSIQIQVNYSIIINKCTKRFLEEIKKEENIQKIYASFNSGKKSTDNFHFFLKDEDMEDQDDMVPILPKQFKDFIEKAPHAIILKENVKEVKVDQFEELKEKYKKEINMICENGKKRLEVLQESYQKIEKERQEFQKQQKEQQKLYDEKLQNMKNTLEKERIENQKELEIMRENFAKKLKQSTEENKKMLEQQKINFEQKMQRKDEENRRQQEDLRNQMQQLEQKSKENEERLKQREKEMKEKIKPPSQFYGRFFYFFDWWTQTWRIGII